MRHMEMSAKGQKRTCRVLFDHLVGAGDERGRHGETKRLGGLEIDNEFELRGLLDRQIGGRWPPLKFFGTRSCAPVVPRAGCRVQDTTSSPRRCNGGCPRPP